MLNYFNIIKLAVMGIPAIIAAILYFQNGKLQEDKIELSNELSIMTENVQIVKKNNATILEAHTATLGSLTTLRKDNELSKKIIADLANAKMTDSKIIDFHINQVSKADDKPATPALKNAIIALKEK